MRALIGLDVGTSGARALAVDADTGELLAEASAGYEILTPAPGLDRAAARGLVGGQPRGARQGRGERRRRDRRPRADRPDARLGVPGLRRRGAAPGAAVERPAHEPPVRGDHRARRGRGAGDRRRQPGADRLPGAEDPVAARARARALRARGDGAAAEGLRAADADRREGDRRLRRVGHAAARRRATAAGRTRCWRRSRSRASGCPTSTRARSARARCARRSRASWACRPGLAVAAGGGDNAAAAIGVGVAAEGQLSSSIGTSGVVFAPTDGFAPDPSGRIHAFCHALPGAFHAMAVTLSAGGSLRWWRDTLGHEDFDTLVRGGGGRRAGRRGPGLPPLPDRRAHAAPGPAGARRVRRADRPPRPRRDDARGDGGRRALAARRAGDHARARPARRRRARGRRRRALGGVAAAAGRRLRPAGAAHRGRRGPAPTARRCSPGSPAGCTPTAPRRWRACACATT